MLGTSLDSRSVLRSKRIQSWSWRAQLVLLSRTDLPPRSQQALAAEVRERGSHELETTWLDYVANGGNATLAEFHGYLRGSLEMPQFERRALEHTLWELGHFDVNPDAARDCCDEIPRSASSAARFATAPSPNLLPALIGRSSPWHPLVHEAAVLIARAVREQWDRIGARPLWRHRRYVGW